MYSVYKFVKARDALRYIVKTFHIEVMHIPYYLCDSVRHALVKENCKPNFYHIKDDFLPDCDFNENDYILYPNYFGICSDNAKKLAKIYPKLILDNAHAFFDEPLGLACFNSAYKFNLDNCSYLRIQDRKNINLSIPDYNKQKEQRIRKFQNLWEKYSDSNVLSVDNNSIPFCYPYLAESEYAANELVKKLESGGLTIYRYWNILPKSYNEYKFCSKLVPIPIL